MKNSANLIDNKMNNKFQVNPRDMKCKLRINQKFQPSQTVYLIQIMTIRY